jgi:voltage-gated potassium channel
MTLQRTVRRGLHHPVTEGIVAVFILVSVALVLVEAALPPSDPLYGWILLANDAITGLFIVELAIRFYAEKNRKRFFKKCWYDILAVLPIFRGFRFLRILRILRLFRFGLIATRRLRRFSSAFRVVRVEYVIIGLIILAAVLTGAVSMRYAEGPLNSDVETLGQATWFALMTLITGEPVGTQPVTPLGRLITVVMVLGGLTVFALFTGTVSAVTIRTLRQVNLNTMEPEDLHDHVVICGWNQAGPLIVDELLHDPRFDYFVLVTETEAIGEHPIVEEHVGQIITLTGDYTRLDCLREAAVEEAAAVLLLADETIEERSSQDRDARTVLAAMLVERMAPEMYTVVQLLNRDNEASLRAMGVEEIIVSEEYVGHVMATVTKSRGIVSMLDELLTATYGHQFFRCPVPTDIVGLEVSDAVAVLKRTHNATLLAVDTGEGRKRPEAVHVNPPPDLVLEADAHLYVAASAPLSKDGVE